MHWKKTEGEEEGGFQRLVGKARVLLKTLGKDFPAIAQTIEA